MSDHINKIFCTENVTTSLNTGGNCVTMIMATLFYQCIRILMIDFGTCRTTIVLNL